MIINDKVAVVTGASEGIGKAIAEALAAKGAKLVLAARNEERLAELAHALGNGAIAVRADMTSEADIRNLMDRVLAIHGRIDILVNNAGQGLYGPIESVDLDQYRKIFALNVAGPLYAMKLAIPQMRAEGGGAIINVSSRVSKNYYPMLGAYASTKYALNALSLTARKELEKDHIIVSVIHPKMTATNFGKNAFGPRMHEDRGAQDFTPPPGMEVDTAEQVAEKTIALIESGEAEAEL